MAALAAAQPLVALRFVDNHGQTDGGVSVQSERFTAGITGLTTADGRFTILMPHPERVFRTVSIRGIRRNGAKTARGCAFSETPGSGQASSLTQVHP